ncbi:KH domain-containing, RNA-binding, signal transduction-associated protein 3-like isoform X2 [Bombyx mandarina]|uniref:K Homology domain-containing protein n=2 Tax=Bombyx TaxID=7090 RepID=A0A8R2R0M4_BOMMO|nr:KH domain-containing, RNA-binding, signal transduction-associated protein 3-like isoform X2 [Bombyx mandarina]XP_037873902.1 KH domain-containing, RNA-binding, signal transduction-associated protein 3 isoform X2 [Bombyx mori]
MADKYDKNGYNSGDFKRNTTQGKPEELDQNGEEGIKINEKAGEYMRELLSEKIKLNNSKFPLSMKLIDQEVTKVQASGRITKDSKYVDVFRDKPTKVTVKVLVPIKEHPKFNFVGKLLGPKGNTMKQLQEDTLCKMAVLGRGSMRDRQKEEELRQSLDPKYSHLADDLHVEISAIAPPAEAHARIAYALAEVKKYLVPDTNETVWMSQMRDIDVRDVHPARQPLLANPAKSILYRNTGAERTHPYREPAPVMHPPAAMPPRSMPPKNKIISILERARTAMEGSYSYEDHYAPPEPPMRGGGRAAEPDVYYERGHERFYEDEAHYREEPREYKASSRDVGTRRPAPHPPAHRHYPRAAPYSRAPPTHKKRQQ